MLLLLLLRVRVCDVIEFSIPKTKYMVTGRLRKMIVSVVLEGGDIEMVDEFSYLGSQSVITSSGQMTAVQR